jgi:hypothetical protein
VFAAVDFIFAVGASSTAEYVVIDAANPLVPTIATSINLSKRINDIWVTDNAAYLVGQDGVVFVITF